MLHKLRCQMDFCSKSTFRAKILLQMCCHAPLAVHEALLLLTEKHDLVVKRVDLRQVDGSDLLVELPSDSLFLVQVLSSQHQSPWAHRHLIEECKGLLAQLRGATITYCPREVNRCANCIAKAHRLGSLPSNWLSKPRQAL